ncbi:hypothetical protein [Streptomyces sp. NBC_01353]|uniref:hypothetical protein n=1 Tax=Streptomyces sp. NBC_01353 TaxID=2903835 RepID=UPI002E3494AC|nr:hypothetical protein [Streptomyces sp. NBC_01353]
MTGPDDPAWRWEFRCEDFVYARLAEEDRRADQTMLPGPAQDQALNRIDSLYLIASQHNIWVDFRGRSAGRCITCKPSDGGVPCLTMTGLARLWRHHPDYRPGWNDAIDRPGSGSGFTYEEYKKRSTIWTRREAELNAFYDRFDLVPATGGVGEFWRCRTCGAQGEEQRPVLGVDIAPAISDGPRRHPTCTPNGASA